MTLDNPYRTVLQFPQLKIHQGKTVIDSLRELKTMLESSQFQNEVANKRVNTVIEFLTDRYEEDELQIKDIPTQLAFFASLEIHTELLTLKEIH